MIDSPTASDLRDLRAVLSAHPVTGNSEDLRVWVGTYDRLCAWLDTQIVTAELSEQPQPNGSVPDPVPA